MILPNGHAMPRYLVLNDDDTPLSAYREYLGRCISMIQIFVTAETASEYMRQKNLAGGWRVARPDVSKVISILMELRESFVLVRVECGRAHEEIANVELLLELLTDYESTGNDPMTTPAITARLKIEAIILSTALQIAELIQAAKERVEKLGGEADEAETEIIDLLTEVDG